MALSEAPERFACVPGLVGAERHQIDSRRGQDEVEVANAPGADAHLDHEGSLLQPLGRYR